MARKVNPVENPNVPKTYGLQDPTFWGGAKAGIAQTAKYSDAQMAQQNRIGDIGAKGLEGLADNKFNFQGIEDWTRKNFAEKTLPSIMSRFASFGTGDSFSGSSFQNAMKGGMTDLDAQLAAMKADYDMKGQALNQNLYGSMFNAGQQQQFDPHFQDRIAGFGENALLAGIQGLGTGAGMYMAGGGGAATGAGALAGLFGRMGKGNAGGQNTGGNNGAFGQRAANLQQGNTIFN
jgi:hypothetical protein